MVYFRWRNSCSHTSNDQTARIKVCGPLTLKINLPCKKTPKSANFSSVWAPRRLETPNCPFKIPAFCKSLWFMCHPKIQLVVFLHWLRSWLGAPVFLAPHYAKLGLICGFLKPIYPVTVLWCRDACRVSSLITLNCEKRPSEHINVSSHKSWPPLRKLTHRLHLAAQYLNYFIFQNFYTASSKTLGRGEVAFITQTE